MTEKLGFSGRIARLFLDSELTPLLGITALLLGLFAVAVTPREEEPQINVTMANVLVPFPGASARDVEALVAGPAEQVLAQMSGVYGVNLTQPEYNDMETIYSHTVDRGLLLLDLKHQAAEAALAAGRDLHGRVHAW